MLKYEHERNACLGTPRLPQRRWTIYRGNGDRKKRIGGKTSAISHVTLRFAILFAWKLAQRIWGDATRDEGRALEAQVDGELPSTMEN